MGAKSVAQSQAGLWLQAHRRGGGNSHACAETCACAGHHHRQPSACDDGGANNSDTACHPRTKSAKGCACCGLGGPTSVNSDRKNKTGPAQAIARTGPNCFLWRKAQGGPGPGPGAGRQHAPSQNDDAAHAIPCAGGDGFLKFATCADHRFASPSDDDDDSSGTAQAIASPCGDSVFQSATRHAQPRTHTCGTICGGVRQRIGL